MPSSQDDFSEASITEESVSRVSGCKGQRRGTSPPRRHLLRFLFNVYQYMSLAEYTRRPKETRPAGGACRESGPRGAKCSVKAKATTGAESPDAVVPERGAVHKSPRSVSSAPSTSRRKKKKLSQLRAIIKGERGKRERGKG